jgi:hypothetical protein
MAYGFNNKDTPSSQIGKTAPSPGDRYLSEVGASFAVEKASALALRRKALPSGTWNGLCKLPEEQTFDFPVCDAEIRIGVGLSYVDETNVSCLQGKANRWEW